MSLMSLRQKKEVEDEAKGFKKRVKANHTLRRTRLKILEQQSVNQFVGEDPSKILTTLKSARKTTSTHTALKVLDGTTRDHFKMYVTPVYLSLKRHLALCTFTHLYVCLWGCLTLFRLRVCFIQIYLRWWNVMEIFCL